MQYCNCLYTLLWTSHLPNGTLFSNNSQRSYEKNMTFLLTPKSQKFWIGLGSFKYWATTRIKQLWNICRLNKLHISSRKYEEILSTTRCSKKPWNLALQLHDVIHYYPSAPSRSMITQHDIIISFVNQITDNILLVMKCLWRMYDIIMAIWQACHFLSDLRSVPPSCNKGLIRNL